MIIRIGVALMAGVLLAACSGSPGESGTSSGDEERPEDRETVFDPMVGTMDRAQGVEDMNADRKDRLDEAMTEQDQ